MLGPVCVVVNGEPVALPSARQRILLARLALDVGRPVSVARLIETLWSGDVPANAQGNLQSYVSRLRHVIGSDQVVHEPGGYRLVVSPADIDVGAARALVAQARDVASEDSARAADLLRDALALWRGDPLADIPDTVAFAPDLAHLDAWRRQLSEDRAALQLTAGDAAGAIPDLERGAVEDPLHERGVELLAQALHDTGRTTDALSAVSSYRRRLADETGLDPGPALRELEQRILTDDPTLRTRPRRPPAPTATRSFQPPADLFVGRQQDVDRLRQALTSHSLVTVVGPGGVGKTRLVLEFLSGIEGLDDRGLGRPGVVFVALAPVGGSDEVAAAVAGALGLASAPTGTIDAIVDQLSGPPSVLVLDNCEHVREAIAELAATLLARCPGLRLLVTSRRRLDVAGERLVRLAPLPTDAQVELFCDRAAMLRPGFDISAQDRGVMEEICHYLDGLPLAVELAAQRESVFGLRQLRDGIVVGLEILDPIGSSDRFRGIAPTAEWSYRLLDESARVLFDRLSVCADGFSLEALVHFAPGELHAEVLLAELVDASLVLADHERDPPRYRILEPIRQMGERHLDRSGLRQAQDAHSAWVRQHIAAARAAQDRRSPVAAQLLHRERANVHQALRRAVDRQDWHEAGLVGIETAVLVVDYPRLDLLDQLAQLDRVLDQPEVADEARARCLAAAGAALWLRGQADMGVARCTAAFDLMPDSWIHPFLRSLGRVFLGDVTGVDHDVQTQLRRTDAPDWVRATAVCLTALMHEFNGDHETATGWFDGHADLLEKVGAVDGFVDYTHGELVVAGDPETALADFERAEARCRAAGLDYNLRVAQVGRTSVLIRLGDDTAVAASSQTLAGLRDAGMWGQVWMMVRLIAELLVQRGAPSTALALLDAADADPLAPPVLDFDRERLAHLRDLAIQSGGTATDVPVPGRVTAVQMALDALAGVG